MKFLKNITAAIISALIIAMLCSCSGSETNNEADSDTESDTNVQTQSQAEYPSMHSIADKLITNCEFPEMYVLEADEISGEYNVDPSVCSDIYAAVPIEYPGIERILLAVLNDTADIESVKGELTKSFDTLKAEYIDYLPEEYAKAKNVNIYDNDKLLCLVVCADHDEALKIIKDSIK